VLYLVFNEGYSASAGDDLVRRDICDRAVALTQVLAELLPAEPEAKGLLALMLFHRSRQAARVNDRAVQFDDRRAGHVRQVLIEPGDRWPVRSQRGRGGGVTGGDGGLELVLAGPSGAEGCFEVSSGQLNLRLVPAGAVLVGTAPERRFLNAAGRSKVELGNGPGIMYPHRR
jgi:hypothetical protein